MSTDYPGLPYLQAEGYTRGRPDGPPIWLVFHTMEVAETSGAAEATARYFQNPTDGRQVSSHTCVDVNSAVQCVRVSDTAWCAGNRPGNRRGIHIEQAGTARQTAAQWRDSYSQAMIRRVAAIHARDCLRFAIPLRWLTVDQIKAARKGFCTHNDLRLAFDVTTHWDPGPNYPKAQVLSLFRTEVTKLTGGGTVEKVAVSGSLPILKYGMHDPVGGAMILRAQGMLNVNLTEKLALDGIYGARTAAAVAFVCRKVGWQRDGRTIDGPIWKLIINLW
jgi:hypothetical protein